MGKVSGMPTIESCMIDAMEVIADSSYMRTFFVG